MRAILVVVLAAAPACAQVLRAPALEGAVCAPVAPVTVALAPSAAPALFSLAATPSLVAVPALAAPASAVPVAAAAAPAAVDALRFAAALPAPAPRAGAEAADASAREMFAESSRGEALSNVAVSAPAADLTRRGLSKSFNAFAPNPAEPPGASEPERLPFLLRHYSLVRALVVPFLKLVYRLNVDGLENLPTGPALIVPNHVTYMDPVLLSFAANRPMRFLMYRGLYETPGLEWLFRGLGAMPISAKDPKEVTAATLERARRLLAAGETVVIFPEGHLTFDGALDIFRRGFERVAAGTNAPVIPAAVDGMWGSAFSRDPDSSASASLRARLRGRRRVTLRFGPALERTDAASAQTSVQALLKP